MGSLRCGPPFACVHPQVTKRKKSQNTATATEEEEEEEGEGGFIAREEIGHSQSRPPRRCIPCHADVVGGLVGRVAAPATKAKFYRTKVGPALYGESEIEKAVVWFIVFRSLFIVFRSLFIVFRSLFIVFRFFGSNTNP